MARLPSVDTMERPSPRPSGNVTPISSGLGGRVLSGTGEAVFSVGGEFMAAQDHVDTLIAEDAFNKLRQRQIDLTLGKQEGFTNVKGGDVFGILPTYTGKFNDAAGAIGQNLTLAQRQKFNQRADVASTQFRSDLMRHITQQSDVYAGEVYQNTLATETDSAVANWNNPPATAASILRINSSIDHEAQRTGWPAAQIAETKTASESKIHRDVIGMMVANEQNRGAQGYYDAVKPRLTAGDQIAVQGVLERARKQIEADTLESVGHTIQGAETNVYKDPAQFDVEHDRLKEMIGQLPDVTEQNKVKYRDHAYRRLAQAKVWGMAERDPEGTATMLRGYDTNLPGAPNRAELESYAAQQERSWNLPKGLLRAVIDQETGGKWDNSLKSPKGAMGLGQLMPGTAKDEGVDPSDPYQNIQGAASYLSKQLANQRGNVPLALAAYNAGPEAVAKHGGIPPYKETQTYVPGVQARAERYAAVADEQLPPEINARRTGDDFADNMPLDLRMKLLREVTTMENQGRARAKHALQGKLQDFTAMAHSGVDIPLTSIPTKEELTNALGPADGATAQREVQASLLLNSDIQQTRGMSYEEQHQLLTARTPVPGEGYTDAKKRYVSLVNAINYTRSQQDDDPGAWTLQNTKGVKDAWDIAQTAMQGQDQAATKQAFEGYASATLAEQQRIGMVNPSILPKDTAQRIVGQFYQQQQGGQNAAQLIQGLAQQWGKYWPQVYGQIQKDIPSSARTIGAGMADVPAARLAGLADVKRDDLLVGLPKGSDTDLRDYLVKKFDQAHRSLLATNPKSGQDVFQGTYNDAEKLGLSYMASGKSASDAADQVYDETFGHRYEFVRSGPAYYRVPKGPGQPTPSAVAKGADAVRANVGDLDLEIPVSLAGLKPGDAKKQWVDVIRSSGYWVTAPDELGLMLYDEKGTAVVDSKGHPIFRSWYALYGAGQSAPQDTRGPAYDYTGEPLGAPTAQVKEGAVSKIDELMGANAAHAQTMLASEDAAARTAREPAVAEPPPDEPVSHADQVPDEPPVAEMPVINKGGEPRIKPLTALKPKAAPAKKYTREYTPDGEPVMDTFPPGEKPKFQPQDPVKLEAQLRKIAGRERLAGSLANDAKDANDKPAFERRIGIINKLYEERQLLLKQLRKVDPKRADKLQQELYEQ